MRKIKLIKKSDDFFKGNHPDRIHVGHTVIGECENLPKIGERFAVKGDTIEDYLLTSTVIEELNFENEFKTLYSTYKIEFLD